MNILILGNGFDLAHGLPTKYGDFLKFCSLIKEIEKNEWNKNENILCKKISDINSDINVDVRAKLTEKYMQNMVKELAQNIINNIWIDYFLECEMYQKENWIDFEREISKLIQSLDDDMVDESNKRCEITEEVWQLSNKYLSNYYSNYFYERTINNNKGITFKEIKDKLYIDLKKLIRALEIYLIDYIEELKCNVVSPDIQNINVDYVLSFNYTNTYEKIYGEGKNIDYDYIHGKGNINNTIETNNMVLGIDEYLSEDRKNNDIEFIEFKKFYQRIHKETGCKYKQWVDTIVENGKNIEEKLRKNFPIQIPFEKFPNKHDLYIFGHSLDITDKDILRDLILNDNVYTTIYYFNKDIYGQQIANLVRVIGQDELIRRTGGNTKTIEFKKQQDMTKKILH